MKGRETTPEKIFVIDIRLNRGSLVALSCALVLAALITVLTLKGDSASASETEAAQAASTGMRQFYLADTNADGIEAPMACTTGYHMASLWEIIDPSNLVYNTDLGTLNSDSGEGPPSYLLGWVRTGYASNTSNTPGRGNCNGWTVNSGSNYGTMLSLADTWTGDDPRIGVWDTWAFLCQSGVRVWCVED